MTIDASQADRIRNGQGFFAALDQSGGSTPKALRQYGIEDDRWSTEDEMFDLVHRMRTRVVSSPAFDGSRVIAAILFEQTMDREMHGKPTASYLWEDKQVVPILKVDKGLADESDHVQLMKPIDTLDDLLSRAKDNGVFGTKMRSVIKSANEKGIGDIVAQQFEVGARIAAAGLVPILEPEVSIDAPDKAAAEAMLHDGIQARLAGWEGDVPLMLKLTIPDEPGRYADLLADDRVLQVVALSGGYSRDEACARLAKEPAMIASFSRALLEGLSDGQSDDEFDATLAHSIAEIYKASVDKQG
ncbi:class I fructose-bisphosphate aldolase [Jatrophihabitans fulvus]